MGYGAYSYEAHQAITSARAQQNTSQVFTQSKIHPSMNPHGVKFRECRDSQEHPRSLAIAFALDVSGSMGEIPEQLARKELPRFMKLLGDCRVESPQVMFIAFTDHESDGRPLQVGQFEATAELMDQWLTRCSMAGGGEAVPTYESTTKQYFESYDLAMHFVARHTAIDCWEKRQKKGYLFVTGDEAPYAFLAPEVARHVLGSEVPRQSLSEVIADASRMYEIFFLVPDAQRYKSISSPWRAMLGDRVIEMTSAADTCAVAAGLVALCESAVKDLDQLASLLGDRAKPVLKALGPFYQSSQRAR